MKTALAVYGAAQIAIGVGVIYMMLNPRAGRLVANAHPWVRGGDGTREGADRGFDGYG